MLWRPGDEIRWLDKVRGAIREEFRQLPRADYVPPSTEAEKQVELLLQPKGTNGNQRKGELCAMMKQSLLEELRQCHGEPPARFVEMVQHGWDEAFKSHCLMVSLSLRQGDGMEQVTRWTTWRIGLRWPIGRCGWMRWTRGKLPNG